jgi:hypothetical protein
MSKLIAVVLPGVTMMALVTATPALAMVAPTTGQRGAPNNTCGLSNPATPGSSASAPGSPFNGTGQAGNVYAGNPGTASLAHSNSTASVSQYDVACIELSH